MFRSIRNNFDKLVDAVITQIDRIFSRGEQPTEQSVGSPFDVVINTDEPESPTDQDIPDIEPEVIDTDESEVDFEEYLDTLDDYIYFGERAEEFRVFERADIEPEYIRHVRYTTSQEAQDFLDEAGLSEFSEILFVEDEDLFTIAVFDSPGAPS